MKIKSLVLLVWQVLYIVDVDESIKRCRDNVVEVWIELNLGDPSLVNLLLNDGKSMLLLLIRDWLLLHQTDGMLFSLWRLTSILPLTIRQHWLVLCLLVLLFFIGLLYLLVELILNIMLMTFVLILGTKLVLAVMPFSGGHIVHVADSKIVSNEKSFNLVFLVLGPLIVLKTKGNSN